MSISIILILKFEKIHSIMNKNLQSRYRKKDEKMKINI